MIAFLLLMAGVWVLAILFALALNKVGSGDPLPPPRPGSVAEIDDSDVVCEGCDLFTAATLLDLARRERGRVVRLRHQGRVYEVRRPFWGRASVRAIA